MMLNIVLFHWGMKYEIGYVKKLVAGISRSLHSPYRIFICTDKTNSVGYRGLGVTLVPIWDVGLTSVKGCFARLRIFDPTWQKWIGVQEGEQLVSIDLDAIVVGGLDSILDRPEPFVILRDVNTSNPCAQNGSIFALRAGYRPDVWSSFSLEAARRVPHFTFPDDQAWFEHKMPDAAGWVSGPQSGVVGFHKRGWPSGDDLPSWAKLVVFPGYRDPSQFSHLGWVQEHWRE